jgi:hypothetical protein
MTQQYLNKIERVSSRIYETKSVYSQRKRAKSKEKRERSRASEIVTEADDMGAQLQSTIRCSTKRKEKGVNSWHWCLGGIS